MPALGQHQSSDIVKMLFIGPSGAGKTGALASLASAGYNLRILDMDNGLDVLANVLNDPKKPLLEGRRGEGLLSHPHREDEKCGGESAASECHCMAAGDFHADGLERPPRH